MSLSGAEVAVVCAGTAEEPNGVASSESSVEMTFLLMEVEIREDNLLQESFARTAATYD
jgi:hypothetical protein